VNIEASNRGLLAIIGAVAFAGILAAQPVMVAGTGDLLDWSSALLPGFGLINDRSYRKSVGEKGWGADGCSGPADFR